MGDATFDVGRTALASVGEFGTGSRGSLAAFVAALMLRGGSGPRTDGINVVVADGAAGGGSMAGAGESRIGGEVSIAVAFTGVSARLALPVVGTEVATARAGTGGDSTTGSSICESSTTGTASGRTRVVSTTARSDEPVAAAAGRGATSAAGTFGTVVPPSTDWGVVEKNVQSARCAHNCHPATPRTTSHKITAAPVQKLARGSGGGFFNRSSLAATSARCGFDGSRTRASSSASAASAVDPLSSAAVAR